MKSLGLASILIVLVAASACTGASETDTTTNDSDAGNDGSQTGCVDADGDGYGIGCEAGPDCDDDDSEVSPGPADSAGDDVDANCDGLDGVDGDGDGVASAGSGGSDCDDAAPSVYPGAEELCDGNDTDCSGEVPANEIDRDGDGFVACEPWNDIQGDNLDIIGGGDTYDADSTPPAGSITTPADGDYVRSADLTVASSDAVDADSGLSEVVFTIRQGASSLRATAPQSEAPYSVSFDTSALVDGAATIELHLSDNNANVATSSMTIILDTAAPQGAIELPSADQYVGGTLPVRATASDITSGVAEVEATLTDAEDTTQSTVLTQSGAVFVGTLDIAELANGPATLTLGVTDFAGNAADVAEARTVEVDNTGDASLSTLVVDPGGDIDLTSETSPYERTVPEDEGSIAITATSSQPGAAVMIEGAPAQSGSPATRPLAPGVNTIDVSVMAVNGATQTYTLNVCRPSVDLASLSITTGGNPATRGFYSLDTQLDHTASVAAGHAQTRLNAVALDSGATLEYSVDGGSTFAALPQEGADISLELGTNEVMVRVTACGGSSSRDYTLTLTRPEWGIVGGRPNANRTTRDGTMLSHAGSLYVLIRHARQNGTDDTISLGVFESETESWSTAPVYLDMADNHVTAADFAVGGNDDDVVVAYVYEDPNAAGSYAIELAKLQGDPGNRSWQSIGGMPTGFTDPNTAFAVALDGAGNPYLAHADPSSGELNVLRHNGTNTQNLSFPAGTTASVLDMAVRSSDDQVYIAAAAAAAAPSVSVYDGTSWSTLSPPTPDDVNALTLELNPQNDVPFLSFRRSSDPNDNAVVRYDADATTWTNAAAESLNHAGAYSVPMAFPASAANGLMVAYHEGESQPGIRVGYRNNADAWRTLSSGLPLAQGTRRPSLVVNDGALYVGYLDGGRYQVWRYYPDLPQP